MSTQGKGPRGPNGGREPSRNVLLPGNGPREHSPAGRGEQALPTASIMSALVVALDRSEPEDRPDLLQWLMERAVLGLLHECGARAAAVIAYRVADGLAGAVR